MRKDRLALRSTGGNLDTLQEVWEYSEEKLTTEEVNNTLLLDKDRKGKTTWHLAAQGAI